MAANLVDSCSLGPESQVVKQGADYECDPACGSGWIRIKEEDLIEGEFRIHLGDDSTFLARRAK